MAELSSASFSETDSSNNAAPPDGFPESMAASAVNNSARAFMGAVKRFWNRVNPILTSAGSATAYTLTRTVTSTTIVTGERLCFKIDETNTGAATLAVDGGTEKNIYKPTTAGPAALVAGDLVIGNYAEVAYDGTQYLLMSVVPQSSVDIHGTTELTAPATADELLTYDADAGSNKRITLANLLKVLNGLTEDTSPDETADFVLTYDTSASAVKKVKPSNLQVGAFSASFVSTAQTITAAGSLTLAHSLGAAPKLVQITLKCIDAGGEAGYAQNDIVLVQAGVYGVDAETDNAGVSIVPDATNLNIRYGSRATHTFIGLNKSTGANADFTNTKWNAIFSAWA